MSSPRVFEIATSDQPSTAVARLTFTPAGAGDPHAGETRYEALTPAGEAWLLLVEEFVTGPDVHVFIEGEAREGPHDRDLRQLEGALRLVPPNFPVLRILGLTDRPPEVQAGRDSAVEAVKSLVRERFVQQVERRDEGPGRATLAEAVREVLAPTARAQDELGLELALGQTLDALSRLRATEELLDVADEAVHDLRADASDASLSPALRGFVERYLAWRVTKPPISY